MTTRMLIDARHREETRVAVVKSNRIEEFDFESAEHKQLKGNIYLAKVTRVEPSLQAAFIEYGGNRHGFLAFSEIHPDYYQIPREDREALLAEEAEAAAEEAALREQEEDDDDEPSDLISGGDGDDDDGSDFIEIDTDTRIDTIDISEGQAPSADDDPDPDPESGDIDGATRAQDDGDQDEPDQDDSAERGDGDGRQQRGGRRRRGQGDRSQNAAKPSDAARAKRIALKRRYRIQDVVHRRQVLLVQVVKEERGNKGAALTTYLSLAGRYCVLMPNTSHGGGISRKISNVGDRKRLKSIVADLQLPKTMGCIVRTAGLSRTKPEIKRDFDYLARLWDEIREKTLRGSAPALIHSDSDLIKRAIRDIYNRDIEEIIVEGDDGFRAARDFMKLLMPSHSRRIKQYADPVPLYQRFGVEDQLAAMYSPVVQLKSGGYIVINPTEALVSIDINSGRSTREHGIEATALNTNLEAAREIARQLRLRDMAGLVVIDFIDMENHGNSRKVERAMKEALKNDRARIQVGRISSFGLMEMSRQRLRTGVLEASTRLCPHCEGTGLVRTASSAALLALRLIEEEAARGQGSVIRLVASQEASFYVLNHKRAELASIEERYGVTIEIAPSGEAEGAKMETQAFGPKPDKAVVFAPIIDNDPIDDIDDDDFDEDEEETPDRAAEGGDSGGAVDSDGDGDGDGGRPRRKKRRRGRRGGRNRSDEPGMPGDERNARDDGDGSTEDAADQADHRAEPQTDAASSAQDSGLSEDTEPVSKPRSRSRTRRPRATAATADEPETATVQDNAAPSPDEPSPENDPPGDSDTPKPARARRSRVRKPIAAASDEPVTDVARPGGGEPDMASETATTRAGPEPRDASPLAANSADAATAAIDTDGPPRQGWWQRTFG